MKKLELRNFNTNDWYGWAGAETIQIVGDDQEIDEKTPEIAYYAGFTIILDGNGLSIYDDFNNRGDAMWYNYITDGTSITWDKFFYYRAVADKLLGNIQNKTRKQIKKYLDENFDAQ